MINSPFSGYDRAELERLVQEAFEAIECDTAQYHGMDEHNGELWIRSREHGTFSDYDFQRLMAADYYLRNTKDTR